MEKNKRNTAKEKKKENKKFPYKKYGKYRTKGGEENNELQREV